MRQHISKPSATTQTSSATAGRLTPQSAVLVQRQSEDSREDADTSSRTLPKKIMFWLNALIPDTVEGATTVTRGTHKGKTMFKGPFAWSDCFLSDSRGFSSSMGASSRIHIQAEADLASGKWNSPAPTSSGTVELDCEDMDVECEKTAQPSVGPGPAGESEATPDKMQYSFAVSASDPCVSGAPDVDVLGRFLVYKSGRLASFVGSIEPFPAFESYVSVDGGTPDKLFTRGISVGKSAWGLYGAPNVLVEGITKF